MKVKMLKFGGIARNRYLFPGQTYDVDEELATDMIADGRATVPEAPRNVRLESTDAPMHENTAQRTGKKR
jgi:hypothetical protein